MLIVFDDWFLWLFLIEFWMSLIIVLDWVLIVFNDFFYNCFWLSMMITFESYYDCFLWLCLKVILIIDYFWWFFFIIYFDCFIVDMHFCGCKIVCFNAFWYHLTLIHRNKWFSPLCSWFVFYVDKGGEIDKKKVREIIYSLWDNFLYMKSSTVSYKQSLQNQGGVNYIQIYIFYCCS